MAWVKLDDNYRNHPKLVKAGPEAVALDVAAMCYSAAYLTDGFVPESAVPSLFPLRNTQRAVDALVTSRRWHRDADNHGYWIHDYLDYNPAAEKVLAEREKEREKKKRQRRNPDGTFGDVPPPVPTGHNGGHPPGLPEGIPPHVPSVPSSSRPPVDSSVSSSSSVEPDGVPDEEEDAWASIVANRKLARRKATDVVNSPRRWLAEVVEDVRNEHGQRVKALVSDHPELTAVQIADILDPLPESPGDKVLRLAGQRNGTE